MMRPLVELTGAQRRTEIPPVPDVPGSSLGADVLLGRRTKTAHLDHELVHPEWSAVDRYSGSAARAAAGVVGSCTCARTSWRCHAHHVDHTARRCSTGSPAKLAGGDLFCVGSCSAGEDTNAAAAVHAAIIGLRFIAANPDRTHMTECVQAAFGITHFDEAVNGGYCNTEQSRERE